MPAEPGKEPIAPDTPEKNGVVHPPGKDEPLADDDWDDDDSDPQDSDPEPWWM